MLIEFPKDQEFFINFYYISKFYMNFPNSINFLFIFRYSESRQNFLYSCDGSGCGKMLIEFHKDRGYSSEVDVFIGLDFVF